MKSKVGTELELTPQAMLAFAAIAREGGVRGAAKRLGTPRSTVSRRLAELEATVGAALVARRGRRFVLTELGVAFAAECESLERVLGTAAELVRRRSTEPSGVLRVVVAPILGEEILPRVLAELLERHPRLVIEARLGADYLDLRHGAVDLALRASAVDDASDLYAVRLGTSVTGSYASPSYLARRGTPMAPRDLAEHECIVVGSRPRATWTFERADRTQREVAVTGRVRVDNFRVARELAVLGAGVVRLARVFAAPLVAAGALVPVLEPYWTHVPIHAVHAGPNPATPSVRAFIDAARIAVAESLGGDGARPWRSA